MLVRINFRILCSLFAILLATFAGQNQAWAKIEAVPGKRYKLSKVHGPCMIMVASFRTLRDDGTTSSGRSIQQIADELVLELRQQGLPAYTYLLDAGKPVVTTPTRDGRGLERRRTLRPVRSVCVIAGNYKSFDDDLAQRSLAWVKKYDPQCLHHKDVHESLKGGAGQSQSGDFQATPGRPRPLSGAFLTFNPLLSPEEIPKPETSLLVKSLNSGVRHSLSNNKGKYTLVVAQFLGKSFSEVKERKQPGSFLIDNDLDYAGQEANDLAVALHQNLDPSGKYNNLEAYVWHDEDRSIVTVGSFDSMNDPAIKHFQRLFGASLDRQGKVDVKYLAIPTGGSGGQQFRIWTFDPTPHVIPVPRLH